MHFSGHLPDLSPLEVMYREKLLVLFERVDSRQPEKGIWTLICRARQKACQEGISLKDALEAVYRGAVERTERRLQLLSACPTKREPFSSSPGT